MTPQEFGIRNSEFGISDPPIASRIRSRFRPARHAGRVPHAAPRFALRRHKQKFLLVMAKSGGRSQMGQPSRLPSGGGRYISFDGEPLDPSARSLRSLGRADKNQEAREGWGGRGANTRWSRVPSGDPREERLCDSPRGAGLRKGFLSGAIDGPERPPVDGSARWSAERCDCRPGERRRNPILGTSGEQGGSRRDHAGVSSHSEKFVTDEADPNGLRDIPVEEVRADRLLDVAAQFLPGFSLGDDGLGQTFGNEAAVHFLGHLEYDFGSHDASLPSRSRVGQPPPHSGRLHELGQCQWRFVGRPSRLPSGCGGGHPPSWHAGRVPHKGLRGDQWPFVGQPSRLPFANNGKGAEEQGSRGAGEQGSRGAEERRSRGAEVLAIMCLAPLRLCPSAPLPVSGGSPC